MAVIKPFQAVRPREDLAVKIAALPYDVYSKEEARKVVMENPLSFLKIDRAETQLDAKTDIYADEVYQCAADTLSGMIQKGEFIKDDKPCLYLYELTMNGRTQTGIGACAAVSEYENKVIKKHENTRQDKEDDRTRHVEACSAQTGPIFLAYRYQKEIDELQKEIKKETPVYDFISEDGIGHKLWVIKEPDRIEKLQQLFSGTDNLYIADGHHRAASAARVAGKRRENRGTEKCSGDYEKPEYEYFLSVLFADRELMVMDYNRWVHDLNGKDETELLSLLKEKFVLKKVSGAEHPAKKGQFAMYLNHVWYLMEKKEGIITRDVVDALDVSVLQNEVLSPILGIEDPKTDQRISFVGGIRGLMELQRLVDEKGGIAFAMYPTSMQELFAVADADRMMPPKSTWFEPKLRSGLLIHQI
jgi:uncharacterized protein (DUF1015 family)